MLVRRILYLLCSLLLCKCCSRCSICNDELLVQGTIHILSGERRWVSCVVSNEFAPFIPTVIMVCIQNCVWRLPVHILRVQGWFGISATCWVSWWLGVRGGTISRRVREGPQCIWQKRSDFWMFSLIIRHNLSNACVVTPVGTVFLILQNIV